MGMSCSRRSRTHGVSLHRWILGLCLGVLAGAGCDRGPAVVIKMLGVPAGATSFKVIARLGDKDRPLSNLPAIGSSTSPQDLRFGIRLPPGTMDKLFVSTAIFAGDCLVATGTTSSEGYENNTEVELPLRAITPQMPCAPKQVIITGVDKPAMTTQGGGGDRVLAISGFGFLSSPKPSTVLINGVLAPVVGTPLGSEIRVSVPEMADMKLARSALGKIPIRVDNNDGTFDERRDLFAYRATEFRFAAPFRPTAVQGQPKVVAGQLRSGGLADLVSAGFTTDPGGLVWWRSDQEFIPPIELDKDATKTIHNGLLLADVNKDGRPDIVAADDSGKGLSVVLNNTSVALRPSTDKILTGRAPSLVAMDVTGDGNVDIIVFAQFDGLGKGFYLFQGIGNGSFKEAQQLSLPLPAPMLGLCSLSAVDLDGDSRPELVAACGTQSIEVYKLTAPMMFSRSSIRAKVDRGASLLVPVDIDGDRDIDLVVADTTDSEPLDGKFVSAPNAVVIMRNAGTSIEFPMEQQQRIATQLSAMAAEDMDRDGLPDLVIALQGKVQVIRNKGGAEAGVFELNPNDFATLDVALPYSMTAEQLNVDGRSDLRQGLPDIAFRDAKDGSMYVLLNQSY